MSIILDKVIYYDSSEWRDKRMLIKTLWFCLQLILVITTTGTGWGVLTCIGKKTIIKRLLSMFAKTTVTPKTGQLNGQIFYLRKERL